MDCGQGGSVIGIVDQGETDSLVDRLTGAVQDVGGSPISGAATELLEADPDRIIAHGNRAVLDLGRTGTTVPILPIDAGPGVRSVSEDSLDSAIDELVSGRFKTAEQCRYTVTVGETDTGVAVSDAMLVTEEPARISEYSIHTKDNRVTQFRADGVVIATPAGSHGYAAAARGPMLAPGTGVVAVPIAQFATDRDSWVLGTGEPVTLRVERDDGPVELLVDNRRCGIVEPGVDVTLTPAMPLQLAVVTESEPYWGNDQ
ncbi:ATP-NAD kinase [Natranaeroarchaeum sulfidigenes]|uniref:NAD kinase n=1 Tax=Natranaeroarchaeum sulfidigenes TaxID=2784880 RepID=A0A897MVM2_9EURY|nr:ATP-NAD kinase [Natranaeroarchaeum sulfidigenes]QSG03113.1 NAD kinase [Natranaeroarchaeum sulfidigenes]